MKRISKILIVLSACIMSGFTSGAQTIDAFGTYTPYTLFGIGDILKQGNAINMGMGGIGVGVRDKRYINYLNPASITERDTLAFMLDFGLYQKNFYNSDGSVSSAYNTLSMNNVVFTAPIYKKSALIAGITPYSSIGYKFEHLEEDPELISELGDIRYQKYGIGGISQAFFGAAITFLKDFSFGAQAVYYFGSLDRYSNTMFTTDYAYKSLITNWDYVLHSLTGSFGLQYSKNIRDFNITAGVTYKMGTNLKGDLTRQAFANSISSTDTLYFDRSEDIRVRIPDEYAAGFTFGKVDKWRLGFDYTRQDWSGSKFLATPGVDFSPRVSQSFKAGFEIVPNRYDVRYYLKRCTYRVGAYYDQSYMKIGTNGVDAMGVTFGFSMPVYRFYNALNFSVDLGQRGSLKDGMIRERYVMFHIGISLHDIWFVKQKYD